MAATSDWKGAMGAEWTVIDPIMEHTLGPFGAEALAALKPLKGKTVIDLGCGGGATSLKLAKQVGRTGCVVGVDVSPDLIELAASRRLDAGAGNLALLCEDAARLSLGQPADALFSRFGAMFFDEPTAAFARIRSQMKPGADLAIVCWRRLKENPWSFRPLTVATPHLPPFDAPPPGAPGPFAWANPDTSFLKILSRSGWKQITYVEIDRELVLGAGHPIFDEDPLGAALAMVTEMGPTASRLKSATRAQTVAARDAVETELRRFMKDGAVRMKAAAWLVRAVA